jgi:methionyl-tRNA formyltransferase
VLPAPPAHTRRLAYLGSPDLAVGPLEALVAAGYEVTVVVSRADKRRGRGGELTPSPVKAAAQRLGLAVSSDPDDVTRSGAELGVVVAFGRLIKPHLLAQVPFVNLHFSLLPRWRGAAPVERAILAGDAVTGVCLMALEEGLDTGPVYRRDEVEVAEGETLEALRGRLVELGTAQLLDALAHGFGVAVAQEGEPTMAAKVDPAELHLDLTRPAEELARVVRLGRAWTTFRGRRLIVWQARSVAGAVSGVGSGTGTSPESDADPGTLDGVRVATGAGWLELIEVQPDGRSRQAAEAWRNGSRPAAGERLGG